MNNSESQIPFLIVGAGVMGLQVAYALVEQGIPGSDIAIFEQNIFPGEHSSSRNSGVLHAGLYYEKNSLKQNFCLEGNLQWDSLAQKLGITLSRPGKYVVATSEAEVVELEKLFEFATEKKVPGLKWGGGEHLAPYVKLKKAFFSKTTGIISVSEVIKSLSHFLQRKNVHILFNQKIDHIEKTANGFEVVVKGERIQAAHVINCGGLFGVELRKKLGLLELEDYWVKGRYLKLNKKFYNESLIYPLPQKGLKGLGIHTSFDLDGVIRFGPDTLDVEAIDYSLDQSVVEKMFPFITAIFNQIALKDLSLDYAGIRSKIKLDGQVYSDFWIKSPIENYWECLGIESPGLTSSPAIAQLMVSRMLKNSFNGGAV